MAVTKFAHRNYYLYFCPAEIKEIKEICHQDDIITNKLLIYSL